MKIKIKLKNINYLLQVIDNMQVISLSKELNFVP